jgi:hypothetical protein
MQLHHQLLYCFKFKGHTFTQINEQGIAESFNSKHRKLQMQKPQLSQWGFFMREFRLSSLLGYVVIAKIVLMQDVKLHLP